MKDDVSFGLPLLVAVAIGLIAYIIYANHAENMACIQAGRSMVGNSCVKIAGDQP